MARENCGLPARNLDRQAGRIDALHVSVRTGNLSGLP